MSEHPQERAATDINRPTAPFFYTVYYRCKDGFGTRVWDRGLTKSEAIAQQQWCFKNTGATMVWILNSDGIMFGELLLS